MTAVLAITTWRTLKTQQAVRALEKETRSASLHHGLTKNSLQHLMYQWQMIQ